MTPSRRSTILAATVVALLVGVATWYLMERQMGATGLRYRWWYVPFVAPGMLGTILVGGVHGGAPIRPLATAFGVANGAVSSLVAYGLARLMFRASTASH